MTSTSAASSGGFLCERRYHASFDNFCITISWFFEPYVWLKSSVYWKATSRRFWSKIQAKTIFFGSSSTPNRWNTEPFRTALLNGQSAWHHSYWRSVRSGGDGTPPPHHHHSGRFWQKLVTPCFLPKDLYVNLLPLESQVF